MKELSLSDIYDLIIDGNSPSWSPKSGLARSGWKVLIPRTERLHRLRNFTLYRIEEYVRFHRSTLSDYEYDYYLSAEFISDEVVCLDICRVFEHEKAALDFVSKRPDMDYAIEKIKDTREG
jgi:hypothetical protein